MTQDKRDDEKSSSQWSQATDWDDPLDVAILYKDFSTEKCGHVMEWKPFCLVDCNQCPICGTSVGLIADGGAVTATAMIVVLCFKLSARFPRHW